MNILVVEDEKNLANAIVRILSDEHINAEAVYDGADGLKAAQGGGYDAVILDLMLPSMSGMEIIKQLRHEGNSVPVLMLTAKTSTEDMVSGLDAGADDYMTKPFESEALLARIRAITRRQGDVVIDVMRFADLSLDLSSHDLSSNGHRVHLSGKEFQVMKMLMNSNSRVTSKQDLLSSVWGTSSDASENSVEAYISFLRKKLNHLHSHVQITTLRMLGYRLEDFSEE